VKNFLFTCLLGLACISCGPTTSSNAVLSEEQMVSILLDIQLTEGKVSSLPVTFDSSQVLYALMEKDIFLKHGVSDSVFTSSMLYYLEDAGKMDLIYARVIDSLVVLENTSTPKE
jgi:ATP sulfurylase